MQQKQWQISLLPAATRHRRTDKGMDKTCVAVAVTWSQNSPRLGSPTSPEPSADGGLPPRAELAGSRPPTVAWPEDLKPSLGQPVLQAFPSVERGTGTLLCTGLLQLKSVPPSSLLL